MARTPATRGRWLWSVDKPPNPVDRSTNRRAETLAAAEIEHIEREYLETMASAARYRDERWFSLVGRGRPLPRRTPHADRTEHP